LGECVSAALVLPRLLSRASLAFDYRAYAACCCGAAARAGAWMGCACAAAWGLGDLRQPGVFVAATALVAVFGVVPALLSGLPEAARARALAFARASRPS
ncbi:MAG TPA: hypothetical protein VIG55_11235, partial [Methylosinus sp.]